MGRLSTERLNWLEGLCRHYEVNLTQESADYLNGRGVNTACQERFRLGTVVDPPAAHKSVEGWLSIPYIKRAGVVGFKFRNPGSGKPKYMSFDPQSLFNVAALDEAEEYIAVCEGELDAIILHGRCGIPAVGLPGADSWQAHPHYKRLLKDFARVYVFADNDVGGERNVGHELARKIVADLRQAVLVELPSESGESVDVTDIFHARGDHYVRALVGERGGYGQA